MRRGFVEKAGKEKTDFFIINSCTVTAKADRDTRSLIRRFHKANPRGKVIVTGCYAELASDRETLANMPGVAQLIRNSEKANIAGMLISLLRASLNIAKASEAISNEEIASLAFGNLAMTEKRCLAMTSGGMKITDFKDRNRAFIKIQDGCDHRCSYCKVSIVRGPGRSRPSGEIVEEARALVEKGFKEIVLTGVSLGAWGKSLTDSNEPPRPSTDGWEDDLAGLVKTISRLEGSFRIRLSSIEPGCVTEGLIREVKSNDKLCKHLHIPLQSGDDKILKLMNRTYTAKKFTRLVKKVRKYISDIAITTDVLLGFPGEDNRSFQKTAKFIKAIRPSRIHVFSYSKREGTAAAKLKSYTTREEVRERVSILTDLDKRLQADFAKCLIGRRQEVLVESQRDRSTGLLTGYTDRYVRVFTDGPDSLKNCLVSVRSGPSRYSELSTPVVEV